MDIGSGSKYPAGSLSNFSPHPFIIDGVECNSAEGWLQSLKFKEPEIQKEVCKLVGFGAKKKGRNKKWFRTQTLYWLGVEMKRDSDEYQKLLDRAYDAMGKNSKFRKALLASGNSNLTHSIGKTKESETVLTKREFCSRLMKLRSKFQEEEESNKLNNLGNLLGGKK